MWLATWNERISISMSIFMLISQFLDATMVLINSNWREVLGQLFINHPFGKYHIVDFASNLFRSFNVIFKRGEVENPFKHATSCLFYAILYHSWMFSNNKILVALHEQNIKLCIWLGKCWNFRRMGMKYCWHMASTKKIA